MKRTCKHCNKEFDFSNPQQYGAHITNCDKNPKQKERQKKIKETISKKLYSTYKFECLNCGKKYKKILTENQYKKDRYKKCCSKKCSSLYSASFVDNKKVKKATCKKCGKDIMINIKASVNNSLCSNCKLTKKPKKCKCCGQITCEQPNICNSYNRGRRKIFNKLGFDTSKIGSLNFYDEYDRIVKLLISEYKNNSTVEIGEKYNINRQTISIIFKNLNIKTRNIGDGVKLSIKKGRLKFSNVNIYPYKSGYYTNNKGKIYWYRSSYELKYCIFLDDNNIDFEMETIRIEYYDTKTKSDRIAIPDFYLPETNEIVEIKSSWTYDEQNMKDKIKKYKEAGYKFKLMLNKKEVVKLRI